MSLSRGWGASQYVRGEIVAQWTVCVPEVLGLISMLGVAQGVMGHTMGNSGSQPLA